MMNVYDGKDFPNDDSGKDGFVGVCPARHLSQINKIYNMLGNIWEWTQSKFATPDQQSNQFVLKKAVALSILLMEPLTIK